MASGYDNFFVASAGASAALLGLLVVAVSVVNSDDANRRTRELRTVLAGSAFVVLADVFIVSMVALVGGSLALGVTGLGLGSLGLFATARLVPRAHAAGNFTRESGTRLLNLTFAVTSAVGYSTQFGLAIALILNQDNSGLQRALIYLLIAFYASALGRAWEVSGITRRG